MPGSKGFTEGGGDGGGDRKLSLLETLRRAANDRLVERAMAKDEKRGRALAK